MKKLLERMLDWLINQVRKRRTIDPSARCVACGNRNMPGTIRYVRGRVIHCCDTCGAFWAEHPRIVSSAWDFLARDEKLIEESAEDLRKMFLPAPPAREKEKAS